MHWFCSPDLVSAFHFCERCCWARSKFLARSSPLTFLPPGHPSTFALVPPLQHGRLSLTLSAKLLSPAQWQQPAPSHLPLLPGTMENTKHILRFPIFHLSAVDCTPGDPYLSSFMSGHWFDLKLWSKESSTTFLETSTAFLKTMPLLKVLIALCSVFPQYQVSCLL